MPIISVIMPVYNGELYVKKSIESILNQTFDDFEFIIINDGSKDSTEEIILSFNDSRIVYVLNDTNIGIVNSLNKGISLARGQFIARMDADDIAFSERLKIQYNYLNTNPEIVLCGSFAVAIDIYDKELYPIIKPTEYDDIKINQLFGNSFIHPSILIKTEIIKEFLYDLDCQYAEDYLLFTKVALKYKVANIDKPLLYYRVHESNLTVLKSDIMYEKEKVVLNYQLSFLIQNVSQSQLAIQHKLYQNSGGIGSNLVELKEYFRTLINCNNVREIYNVERLNKRINNIYYDILYSNHKSLKFTFYILISSPFFSLKYISFKKLRKLFKLDLKYLFGL